MPLIGSAYCLRKSKYGCEGTVMHLECETGKYISPVRANFGRFEAGKCNAENNQAWSTRCIQPTTLRQVNSLCAGKATCSIDVTSQVFGDACPGTYKYLEVHYTCKNKVDTNTKESNLPPWLLKMTATTAKPSTTSTTTEAKAVETTETPVAEIIVEETFQKIPDEPLMSVEDMEKTLIDILGADYIDMSENIENEVISEDYLPVDRTLYVNLPLQEQEPAREDVEMPQNTILLASLVSVLICTLLIFFAAVLFTKYRKHKAAMTETPRKELVMQSQQDAAKYYEFRQNQQQQNQDVYNYDSSSSTNSTVSSIYTSIPDLSTVGSIYTTLPNGDKAIIIPMPSNQQYLRHILANPKLENFNYQQQQQANAAAFAHQLAYGLPTTSQQQQNQLLHLQANNLQTLLQPTQHQQQQFGSSQRQQFDTDNIYYDIDQNNQF